MALITYQDVENEMSVTFSTTTTPTLNIVNNLITRSEALIQGYLKERYGDLSSITDATALTILKDIALALVVGKLNRIIKEIRRLTNEEEETTTSGISEAMKKLREIRDGKLILGNATSNASQTIQYDEDMEPTYEKGEEDW